MSHRFTRIKRGLIGEYSLLWLFHLSEEVFIQTKWLKGVWGTLLSSVFSVRLGSDFSSFEEGGLSLLTVLEVLEAALPIFTDSLRPWSPRPQFRKSISCAAASSWPETARARSR